MGINNAFEDTTDEDTDLDKPISRGDVVETAKGNRPKDRWWSDANLQCGYLPFLVEVLSRTGDDIKIRFVDCDNGDPIPLPTTGPLRDGHPVNMDDMYLVHRGVPSTPFPDAWPQGDDRVVILMLNHQKMSKDMLAHAKASNAWPDAAYKVKGKWPGGAPERALRLEVKLLDLAQRLADLGKPVPQAELDAALDW